MLSLDRLKQEATDLGGSLRAPLSALAVSLISVWLAGRWLAGERSLPLVVSGVVIILAYLLDWMGNAVLPDSPRLGVALLELWVFAPLMVGATASAAMVVIAVNYAVADTTPAAQKELINTTTAAVASFLTSGFIAWASDKDDSRVAKRIQRAFYAKYKRKTSGTDTVAGLKYFEPESRGERLVYSEQFEGIEGWGREARHTRAKELSLVLSSEGT